MIRGTLFLSKMENPAVNSTFSSFDEHLSKSAGADNTTTFLIGFGILLIFVIVGILASIFLCITLKKDAYLWEIDRQAQLQQKDDINEDFTNKDKKCENNDECTEI